jgi:hypothetical protein
VHHRVIGSVRMAGGKAHTNTPPLPVVLWGKIDSLDSSLRSGSTSAAPPRGMPTVWQHTFMHVGIVQIVQEGCCCVPTREKRGYSQTCRTVKRGDRMKMCKTKVRHVLRNFKWCKVDRRSTPPRGTHSGGQPSIDHCHSFHPHERTFNRDACNEH